MNKTNFYSKKELLFLGTLFFAALVSLFFFINFRTLAFPEHNIKFDITREQAAEKAKSFVSDQKLTPDEFKNTTVFSIDDATKTYLEREVGVTETARLAENEVDVWHFTTRFFKPLEQAEITVAHLPNGKLIAFHHEVEESAPGAALAKGAAQNIAEGFLERTVKADLSEWILVNTESSQRTKRIDHIFTWEKKGFKAKDATYRMEVQIVGDKIGGYYEYLKIPEAWLRAYEKETSNNDLAQTIAEVVMFLVFGLAIMITFILGYRRNNLRLASLKAIALTAAGIAILTALNSIPLSLSVYPTTVSWEAFIGSIVLISLLGGLFEGASVLLIIAAGEAKFREMFPQKLSLESMYGKALGTKSVNKALLVGTFSGIIFFTYELLYYFLGKSVGFWAPAAINYSDIYSTVLPWIYPMFIGFLAAASEEGIFRLFGIPFLKKYLKSTWVAIIITSIVWGFLHSNYPQSPWFVRGIEISIIGVVLGWLFVRYGFLASFTAHYTFNALQTAISFYQSGNFYASVSSTIVSLLPFIIAVGLLIVAFYKQGFAHERKEDRNENLKSEKIPAKENLIGVRDGTYKPLTRKRKGILAGLSLAAIGGFLVLYPQTSLEQVPTSLDREEVANIAEETLAKRSINTEGYKSVITFSPKDITTEEKYILEVKDFKTLRSVYPQKLPLAYWSVRYFKPLQKESFQVDVLPDGRVIQVIHELDEKAPSANLSVDQARKLAEAYLVREKGYKLSGYKLVENKAEKKEKRTDHVFVYEEKNANIGAATYRTEVGVVGKEVTGYDTYLKLPEAWLREQMETTTFDFVIGGLIGLFGVGIAWLGFKTFLSYLQSKKLNFRLAYKISAMIIVFSIIGTLNSLSVFYGNYETAIPLETYIIQSILISVIGFVFSFFMIAVVIVMFLTLWKEQVGQIIPKETKGRVGYVKDAIIAGYSIPLMMIGISSILVYILIINDWLTSIATFDTFPQLDTFSPALATVGELPMLLGSICFIIGAFLLLKQYCKTWKRVLFVTTVFAVILALPQQRTAEDIIIALLQNLLILYGGVLIVTFILKKNMLAYFFMIAISMLMTSGWVLFLQPNIFFKINGMFLLLFAVFPAVLYFFPKLLLEFKFGRMVQ